MTEWKEVFGTEQTQPEIFDTKSSPTTVYQRKNIQKVEIKNEFGNITGWKREERELTPEEYSMLILMNEIKQDILNVQKEQIIDEYTLQLINEGTI